MRKIIFIIAAVLSFYVNRPKAAEISWYKDTDDKAVVVFSGEIRHGDYLKVIDAGATILEKGLSLRAISLNSPGGYVSEGYRLSDLIRKMNVDTIVADNAKCASACFMLFAAGKQKFVGPKSMIGVHSAGLDGEETHDTAATTVAMSRYVRRLGVPAAISGRMVTTTPEEMAWLTPYELMSMGALPLGTTATTEEPHPEELNPYAAKEAEWLKYTKWATAAAAASDVSSRPRKNCKSEICVTIIPYLERTRRYAEAVEIVKEGQVKARLTCRQTYETDTYRVCTDFISEQNTAWVRGRNGWVKQR